jgi:hypothetical protein
LDELLRKAWLVLLQNIGNVSSADIQDVLSVPEMLLIGQMTPEERFLTMGHSCKIKTNGLSATLAKARDFMRLMSILTAAATNPLLQATAQQKVDPLKLWRELLKMSNINPDRIERDDNSQGTPADNLQGAGAVNAAAGGATQGGTPQVQPIEGEPAIPEEIAQAANPTGGL